MKYHKGDRVKIVDNTAEHMFEIGELVTIERVTEDPPYYRAVNDAEEQWNIKEEDCVYVSGPRPSPSDASSGAPEERDLSFMDLILENLPRLNRDNLLTIQECIEATLGAKSHALPVDLELKVFINKGEMLQAVKRYKDHTGLGLKECKEYVDALKAKMIRNGEYTRI